MNRISHLHQQLTQTAANTKVELEKVEQIGIIYLNSSADLNSLSTQMKAEIGESLRLYDSDDSVKVILMLSKVEKAFCAGANIKDLQVMTYESQLAHDTFEVLSNILSNLKKPLIVGVNGVALGGGFEMALCADIIVATEDARFGLPELKLGFIPGIGGTQRLSLLAGRNNAMRYILTSDLMSSTEAKQIGVVSVITKKEELKEECIKLAKKITEKSLYTILVAKQAIKNSEEMPYSAALKQERVLFSSLMNTKAAKEGVAAFIEKRKPNFKDI